MSREALKNDIVALVNTMPIDGSSAEERERLRAAMEAMLRENYDQDSSASIKVVDTENFESAYSIDIAVPDGDKWITMNLFSGRTKADPDDDD